MGAISTLVSGLAIGAFLTVIFNQGFYGIISGAVAFYAGLALHSVLLGGGR